MLQSDIATFPRYGSLYGYSPFREVQLLIDGHLAGVVWPFPIIFTGGVVPGLWRPIVGIDAFDLREDEIDITPWLGLLSDGNAHTFEVRVAGLYNNSMKSVELSDFAGSYWLITGKIFVWLDDIDHTTTGSMPNYDKSITRFQAKSSTLKGANGKNHTLLYEVHAHRDLLLRSIINLSTGPEPATWHQSLKFANTGNFTRNADIEINNQRTFGQDTSSSGYARQYNYPLYAYSEYEVVKDNIYIVAEVSHGKDVKVVSPSVFPTGLDLFSTCRIARDAYPKFEGAWLATTQTGTATYLANETALKSFSFGQTEQDMTLKGIHRAVGEPSLDHLNVDGRSKILYHRRVEAINGTVVQDNESLLDTPIGHVYGPLRPVEMQSYVASEAQRHRTGWKTWK